MRRLILIFMSVALFPVAVYGQKKDLTDEAWPPLPPVNGKTVIVTGTRPPQPWSSIDLRKLEKTTLKSNPLAVQRCNTAPEACILREIDFYSERAGMYGKTKDVLRAGVMMHHYPYILAGGHGVGSGTYVYFLPKENLFYLWGDCWMNHSDTLFGPFAGDPRVVLKSLAHTAK